MADPAAVGRGRTARALALAATPALAVGAAWIVVAHVQGAPADPVTVAAVPVAAEVPLAGTTAPASSVQAATVSWPQPSPQWVADVAARTGIPARALQAYAAADLAVSAEDPGCGIGWTTLAGIGAVESDHGRHGGAVVDADGVDRPTVLGPALDGTAGNRALPDTDGGRLDGDPVWDRAVGPMQFIPTTWATWGRSATGATPDPSDVDDAALTAATYLCAAGTDMSTPAGWTAAIASYNAPYAYAVAVADAANRYAESS